VRVLVACEYSGVVRDAFIARGHDAMSCDIIPSESPGPHHLGDVLEILDDGWDLMIAHPPCTYISNAGAKHLYKGGEGKLNEDRYKKGLEAKEFFLKLLNAPIDKICIENPIPSLVFDMPPRSQYIQPFEHGHPYQKKTCLWLKNLPILLPSNIVQPIENTRLAGNWFNRGGLERQKNRAKTFEGIAQAMATQGGNE
jgi:hypothetical protein